MFLKGFLEYYLIWKNKNIIGHENGIIQYNLYKKKLLILLYRVESSWIAHIIASSWISVVVILTQSIPFMPSFN